MTYLQTEYFLHVAQTKSITRTSADLYISPPAISKQISLLEEELGFSLFIRGPRGMELTPAGELMYNHFFNQKNAFDYTLKQARSVGSMETIEFNFGISAKWAIFDELHQLSHLFSQLDSPPHLKFHSCFNPGGSQPLERGELDAVLCISNEIVPYAQQHDLEYKEVTKIPKVFLYSKVNKAANIANPKPSDLQGTPLLTLSSKPAMEGLQKNLKLCRSLGLQPSVIMKDTLDDVLIGLSMNEGFFVCDSWFDTILIPDFRHIAVPDFHSIVLAWWKHNRNPYLQKLIDFCTYDIQWPYSVVK